MFSAPAYFLTSPWMGILRRLGLTEGEWIVGPSFLGVLVVAFSYAVFVFVLFELVYRALKK